MQKDGARMKAVFRLTKSQQTALVTLLRERVGNPDAIHEFLDVSVTPPIMTTTMELLCLFREPKELETDIVKTGTPYRGIVSMYLVEERKVFVTLQDFAPVKHVKADTDGELGVGDPVEVVYGADDNWRARKASA